MSDKKAIFQIGKDYAKKRLEIRKQDRQKAGSLTSEISRAWYAGYMAAKNMEPAQEGAE